MHVSITRPEVKIMKESRYERPYFFVREERSDGTIIETMREPTLPKYVWAAIWELYDENGALKREIDRLTSLDQR